MPSNLSLKLTRQEAVQRALSQVGQGRYDLGAGGRNPSNKSPFGAPRSARNKDKGGRDWCDCSGFIAWCLGYDRVQNLGTKEELWYSCREIISDSYHDNPKLFSQFKGIVNPGDIIVYGPKGKMKWGHIGIVTKVLPGFVRGSHDWWKFVEVTHCSTGNGGVAIRTSNAKLWFDSLKKKDSGSYFLTYNHFLFG